MTNVVVVTGSREWKSRPCYNLMWQRMRRLPKPTIIVHGNCRGADKMAARIAKRLGMNVKAYPADWDKYGPEAGSLRNQRMLSDEKPDLVLAFHEDYPRSKGTKDCIRRAREMAIDWELIEI